MNRYELQEKGVFVDLMPSADRYALLASRLHPVLTQFPLVRLGSDKDGGYLIPEDLGGIEECFSPGVDVNSSFERDLLARYGIGSHLADGSVDGPPAGFFPLSFTKQHIGPNNCEGYSSLASWVKKKAKGNGDLLLQMDIEGGEYLSIVSTPDEVLTRFRILVVEIHCVESWGCTSFFEVVEAFVEKLVNIFHCVHLHPNNHDFILNLNGFRVPRSMEATFLRKDRSPIIGYRRDFPHALDRRCFDGRPEITLPQGWIRAN